MTERRTSVAKDAMDERVDWIQERYGVAKESFNQAREDEPSISHENTHLQEQVGSKMVANDQPKQNMRPPPDIARPVDRESFDDRWTQEQARVNQEQDRANRDYDRGDDFER